MSRMSSGLVVLTILLSSAPSSAQIPSNSLSCDSAQLHAVSYRLTTEAQALNLTRPRTAWWDAFDATLWPYRDALADLNHGALAIAERAGELDDRNLLAHAQIARQLMVLGEDGDRAQRETRRVFDSGGAIVWTATLYDVEARDYFLMAFDAQGIRVYRFGAAVDSLVRHLGVPEFPGPEALRLWRALGGCLEGLRPEAAVSWADVHEIKAGNYVLYFKFRQPVHVASDRGRSKTLREFKVALHGAMGTVEYHVSPPSDRSGPPSVRGIGIGPTAYQDRIRRTLAAVIDPLGRIALPRASRGAGW
jgi:hypothetical protein